MSLKDRLIKNSKIKKTVSLDKSDVFKDRDFAMTDVYALNIAYGGSLFGGVSHGLTFFAAPSKHFKTLYTLISVKAYLDKYEDAICIFYDTEGGTPQAYFKALNIDPDRVIYTPIKNIEQLKFDMPSQLDAIVEGEKVIFAIDSLGNLASKKEAQDALDEKTAADMSRAREMKSFTRIITPELRDKKIPCIAIGHVYQEMALFPKTIMSGGCVIEGTEVLMADGTIKEIQDIVEGEFVKTAVGDYEVTHTWNPETLENGTPECYEIEFDDGTVATISANDHLFIDGKLVEIKDLKEGDLVQSLK